MLKIPAITSCYTLEVVIDLLKIIILGVVEGITEFLPISSTGHLLVTQKILNFQDDNQIFTVVIQLGAILAAIWYFRRDLRQLITGLLTGEKSSRQLAMATIIGIVPAGLAGLVVEKTIGLPSSLGLIASSLIVGGLIMIVVDKGKDHPARTNTLPVVSMKQALLIGLAQCLSIVPGVSRSGSTIIGGILAGLDRESATRFSFYLSIPIMLAASGYQLISYQDEVPQVSGGWGGLILGTAVSAISAFIAIKWLLGFVRRNSMRGFGIYRIIFGILIGIILLLQI